jgi:hypothetical protein
MRIFLEIIALAFVLLMIVGVYVVISNLVDRMIPPQEFQDEQQWYIGTWDENGNIEWTPEGDPTAPEDEHPLIQLHEYKRKGLKP